MTVRPGYKQTDLGIIPTDWDCVTVTDLAARRPNAIVGGPFGSDLVSADYVSFGVPVIRGQNMGSNVLAGEFVFVSPEKAKRLRANNAVPGDIIFTQRGTLGQVALVPDKPFSNYVISQSQMKLTPDLANHDPAYVLQYFRSGPGQRQIIESAIQTGVPHTNLGILRGYKLPAPPLPEQQAIAKALGDVDALILTLDRLIAKKRDLKRAAMQQLLTGQTRLPGFKGEWEMKRLGDVATFHKGKGLPKSALTADGTELCIHYGELFTRYPEIIDEVISRTSASGSMFRSVANDVLMPTSDVTPRGLAKASSLQIDGVILGGDILVIRSDKSLIFGSFLSYLIRYEEEQVLKLVTGSTVFHLYGADMKTFTLSMPQLSEQTAIAEVLSGMDAELAALELRRDKTRALKQGMMQELLTGRTRLVSREVAHA